MNFIKKLMLPGNAESKTLQILKQNTDFFFFLWLYISLNLELGLDKMSAAS